MGVGLNHPHESLQIWDILRFQSFYNTQDQEKKSLNQVNIMVCYIIIIMQDLLKRVEVNKQNQKTGDDLTKKKWERQTWRLLASSLKWEKNLSASIPQILTNLIHWKFDLHFVLHCNVCKRDSCQDPGSGSPVDFSSMLLFD